MQQVDVTTGENTPSPEEEVLLAGKYKTEDELQKGVIELLQKQNEGKTLEEIYKSFESNMGKPPEESPPEGTPSSTEEDTPSPDEAVNLDEFAQEYLEKGELSEDSYAKLQEKGFSKDIVDAYIAGQEALREKQSQTVFQSVGGEENYNAMIQWAATNLTQDQIEAYNQAVGSGDAAQVSFAVEGLFARYSRATPAPPKKIIQGSSSTNLGNSYRSLAEMRADMSDPRYKSDPAFRKTVEQKLANSNIL